MSERPVRDDRLAGYARQSSALRGAPLISLPRRGGPLPWDGWTGRHAIAMLLLVPALYAGFHGVNPSPGRDLPLWILATLVLAGLGALVLATYVPRRRAGGTASGAPASDTAPAGAASGLPTTAGATPCAAMAGGSVFVAMVVMSSTPGLIGVAGGLALMAFGLYQRTSGTCGV
ncbi:MAG: hypothetical protein M0Z51_13995 [Propionibacterium sp.]|nr:hypothetical protein [Propionibacterium sp.]